MAGEVGAPLIGAPLGAAMGEAAELIGNIDNAMGGYGKKALTKIAETPPAKFVGGVLAQSGEKAIEFAEKYPEATGLLNATFNLGTLGIPFVKYGDDILTNSYKAIKNIKPNEYMRFTADELREKGGQMFELTSRQGGGVKPELWSDFVKNAQKKISNELDEPWLKSLSEVGGESTAFDDAVKILSEIPEDPRSFLAIQKADKILGDLAESNILPNGKYTKAGKDFLTLQTTLRETLDNASDDLFIGNTREALEAAKEARKLWSASYRLDDIDRIMSKAEGALQPTTIIKNGFRRLRDNPKKMKKYTPEEQFYIRKAAKTGLVEGAINLSSSRLAPLMSGAVGLATGGPAGGLAVIPAELMRRGAQQVGTDIAIRKGEQAARSVISTATGQVMPNVSPYLTEAGKAGFKTVAPISAMEAQRQENIADRARRLFKPNETRITVTPRETQ